MSCTLPRLHVCHSYCLLAHCVNLTVQICNAACAYSCKCIHLQSCQTGFNVQCQKVWCCMGTHGVTTHGLLACTNASSATAGSIGNLIHSHLSKVARFLTLSRLFGVWLPAICTRVAPIFRSDLIDQICHHGMMVEAA